MKNLIILSLGLLLAACSAVDKTDIEINPRPTLTLGYSYLNGEGRNTTDEEVAWLDIFVFDPAGCYVKTLHAGHDELTSPKGLPLLDGVPAGEYTVVSYANAGQSVFAPIAAGTSTLSDLFLALGSGATYNTCDPLFHHLGRYQVERGEPVVTPVTLNKLYYRINLSVNGADKIEDFCITFIGAPSGIDYNGEPLTEPVVYQPALKTADSGGQSGSLCIPRFTDGGNVTMVLASGQRQLAKIALSEYLQQSDSPIDLMAKDVVIPIDIEVNTANITVTVNEWEAGAWQTPIVGH